MIGVPATTPLDCLHRHLPGYRPTPLRQLPELAQEWDVRRVLLKDETSRLGLPSFKILGASWGAYQTLLRRHGLSCSTQFGGDVARLLGGSGVRLVTATDGNHGRAVARMAGIFGLPAQVFVPQGAVSERVEAIRSEGADVVLVEGDYDAACAAAAAALDPQACLVSDMSWPGHTRVPQWVSDGYRTMLLEIDDVVPPTEIDTVFVPVGVGALAASVVAHYSDAAVVAVEPEDADCLGRSLAAGSLLTAPGPHRTAMAGLNCGTPSSVAWPSLRTRINAAVTVSDGDAAEAMRLLAAAGIAAGATGAAATAGATLLLGSRAPKRAELGLDRDSTVLLLVTEGVTDPGHYTAAMAGSC
jgi:diaminopropionate ammonia-lyase